MKSNNNFRRPEPQRRVGIWIRVSTEDQAQGQSPATHEERARAYCKFNDCTVVELYDLSGVSGKSVMKHPETIRMLNDIKRKHIDGLVFSKIARLARNTKELLELSDIFRDCCADMMSIQEKIDTSSPAGRLFYTLIAALAQWEREEIADRVKSSIKTRAASGKNLGGAAPFGYVWIDKKLKVQPTEGPVRKLIYELFAKEQRKKSVARILNNQGYRTRNGSKFTDTTIVRLIRDTTAKGWYRGNHTYRDGNGKLLMKDQSEWVTTPVESLVSEELWNQCNDILAERKEQKGRLGPKPKQLFAGLIECGCGEKMYVFSRSPKYVCHKCRNKIPIQDMDSIFREELKNFFISKEKVKRHLAKANLELQSQRDRLASHKQQLEKLKGEMGKVYELYQKGEIPAAGFGKLYNPLEERSILLSNELPKLQGALDAAEMHQLAADEVVAEAANLYKRWPNFSREEKRSIVESITEKVILGKDKISITLCCMPSSDLLTKRQRHLSGSSRPPA